MSEKRTSLEIIAPTVEEAIYKGLNELNLPENAVDVEVLDAGSRGLFGIGSRQARVRLKIKPPAPEKTESAVLPVKPKPRPERVPVEKTEPAYKPILAESAPSPEPFGESEKDLIALEVAQDTVRELLQKMRTRAEVTAHVGEADDVHSKVPICVDIHGDDLSILIGPRAETLNALQYITNLIVSAEVGHSVSLIVDVEGYRVRRAQQLRQLARRMADQAIKTGKRQVLEPMPAGERRLVHIELRSNPMVTTESVGEEPRRKVTIIPKGA